LAPSVPPIPEAVIEGLGKHGLRFVAALWSEAQYSGAHLELLRHAGRALDDAETAANPRDRRQASRLFSALVAQLEGK
jgi:hypothetical protein